MQIKQIAGTAAVAGALGAAALGVGAGFAQAKPHPAPPPGPGNPPTLSELQQLPPGQIRHVPEVQIAPGTNVPNPAFGVPPGQLKKMPELTIDVPGPNDVTVDNPVEGVPPGHWDDVNVNVGPQG